MGVDIGPGAFHAWAEWYLMAFPQDRPVTPPHPIHWVSQWALSPHPSVGADPPSAFPKPLVFLGEINSQRS